MNLSRIKEQKGFSTSEKLLLLGQEALVLSERLLMFLLQVLVLRELFM